MRMFKILAVFFALCLTSLSQAEQMKQLGIWDVHYIALTSSFLTPEVARTYGIQRSKYNALVNISVLDSTSKEAQKVLVTGTATDLMGRSQTLEFKEITEGKAIYYIATLSFRYEEDIKFDIRLAKGNTEQKLTFQQKLYIE